MKNIKLAFPIFYIFAVVVLVEGCRQITPTADLSAVRVTASQSAGNSTLATQTQSALLTVQALPPTVTSLPPLSTATPTYVPVALVPTTTLPPVTAVIPLPLENIRLSGKIVYDGNQQFFSLSDYRFEGPINIEAYNEVGFYYPPSLYGGSWSADGKYVALRTEQIPISGDTRFSDLSICIFDVNTLNDKPVKCIRIYTNLLRPTANYSFGGRTQIQNISWSPDNQYLLVTVKEQYESDSSRFSPCMIEIATSSVDCHWANMFTAGSYRVQTLLRGAYAISWSPNDRNKLAVPLKRDWHLLAEGVEGGYDRFAIMPWDLETGDLKQGLYLIHTKYLSSFNGGFGPYSPSDEEFFSLLWEVPQNTTIDPQQLPVWTSDGKQISFVYIDPWITVAESSPTKMPIANFVVGVIGEDGKNFQKLFDSRTVYLSGVLPSESSLPAIYIHRWVYQDRFLLFTARIYFSAEDRYEQSLFLYDTQTNQFFPLTNWNEFG